MAFTDEDLKRLKKTVAASGPGCGHKEHIPLTYACIPSLLARLEAAELAMRNPDDCRCFEKECWHVSAINRWRHSAGKEAGE